MNNQLDIDWTKVPPEELEIIELPEFIGKTTKEVKKYVLEKYSDEYYIPGVLYQYVLFKLFSDPSKIPEKIKKRTWLHFFGINFYNDNPLNVPFLAIDAMEFFWHPAVGNDVEWFDYCRVILLSKKNFKISKHLNK